MQKNCRQHAKLKQVRTVYFLRFFGGKTHLSLHNFNPLVLIIWRICLVVARNSFEGARCVAVLTLTRFENNLVAVCQNISRAELIPKCSLLQEYLPLGVINVRIVYVRSVTGIYQIPFTQSSEVKYLAPCSCATISPGELIEWWRCLASLLTWVRSIQILILLFPLCDCPTSNLIIRVNSSYASGRFLYASRRAGHISNCLSCQSGLSRKWNFLCDLVPILEWV